MLLNFLKNPKFDVRPLYRVIQEEFVPLRDEIEWGFNDIYGISGHMNQHPRNAMRVIGLSLIFGVLFQGKNSQRLSQTLSDAPFAKHGRRKLWLDKEVEVRMFEEERMALRGAYVLAAAIALVDGNLSCGHHFAFGRYAMGLRISAVSFSNCPRVRAEK